MRAFTVSAIYASFSAKLYLEKWHNCAVLPNIYQIIGFLKSSDRYCVWWHQHKFVYLLFQLQLILLILNQLYIFV